MGVYRKTISMTAKPKTHPIYKKYEKSEKLGVDDYWSLHKEFLTPLPIKIDTYVFKDEIENYKRYFKPWGSNRPELNEVRQGLPLVNSTGLFTDDVDISIGPLDHHNSLYPENCMLENDFKIPTDILNLQCFDVLDPIRKHMVRSSILYWKKGANFDPHWDVILPTVNLRLWGTSDPSNIQLRYRNNEDMVVCEDVEPGRLYLIETSTIHDAACLQDDGYQFFIALNVNSFAKLKDMLNVLDN